MGVKAHPILGGAVFLTQIEFFRIKGEVRSAEGDGFERGFVGPRHGAAVRRCRAPDTVVGSPAQAVEEGLHVQPDVVPPAEAGEDGALLIADAVAVGVFEIVKIGSGADEDATVIT